MKLTVSRVAVVAALAVLAGRPAHAQRATLRQLGVEVGILPPGPTNGIVDVAGVLVGHTTIARGDSINTGVTALLAHGGNVFRRKVPAAIVVGNGFGKLVGVTQVRELGELESPVLLTCTLCVPRVADAALSYLLGLPGNEDVRSANVVVGETNDGFLNDIRARAVTEEDVLRAIRNASSEPVEQGSIGAGRGTTAFGWKGGIGTASRRLPEPLGGWTVGVLVQSNFGGILSMDGVPVGRELGRYYMRQVVERDSSADGSVMIVLATDAPIGSRNLERLANRALAGLARTGSAMTNGSGDYVIAFSTTSVTDLGVSVVEVPNARMSPLFLAAIEATEEAIYNSLVTATTVVGHRGTVAAIPVDDVLAIMRRYGRLEP
ncbi:MAG: P1 family peptidase [Gemmatimonadales bacterium]